MTKTSAALIQLDPASSVPLYRQIAGQLRRQIALGALRPGDRLPAVRDLAVLVRVNRNTAARAIQQLEGEGYLRTRVGQGTFVERAPALERARGDAAVDQSIDGLLVEAQTVGVPLDELPRRVRRRIEHLLERRETASRGPDGGKSKGTK